MSPSPVTLILSLILHCKWQPCSQNLGFKKRAGRGGRPLGWCGRVSSGFPCKPSQNFSFRSYFPPACYPQSGCRWNWRAPSSVAPAPPSMCLLSRDFQIPTLSEMWWNLLSSGFYAPVVSTFMGLYWFKGLPLWLSGKESTCQCRKCDFDPWLKKIPWRREWQPTPVSLFGKSRGQRLLEGYSPWGCKRVGHDLVARQQQLI